MGQNCMVDFLVQRWFRQIQKILQIIFLCKVVYGLWANIAQVFFLCKFGPARSRQHYIGYFPERGLCALAHHYTNNFLVQCCLRCIQTTLARYSYEMLPQHDQRNIIQIIIFCFSDLFYLEDNNIPMQCCPSMIDTILPLTNIALIVKILFQLFSINIPMQCCPSMIDTTLPWVNIAVLFRLFFLLTTGC